MKKYVCIFCVIALCMLLCNCTSDTEFDSLKDIVSGLTSHIESTATISVTFESSNDIDDFENRVKFLGITIAEKNEANGSIEYKLTNNREITSGLLEGLAENYSEACVIDSDGNVVLQTKDINKVAVDRYSLCIYVDDSIYEQYEYRDIINFALQYNGQTLSTYPGVMEKNGEKYIDFMPHSESSDYERLWKIALAFSGIEYEASVSVEVLNVTKPVVKLD